MKDKDIREELHNNHLSHFVYDSNSKVVNELGLLQGSFKIDIAVINGSLIGYEIKSEEDTLYRLPAQMNAYNKVFDFINIVINDKYYNEIKTIVPEFWGIICVKKFDDDFKLVTKRKAEKNHESDAFHVCQLLWKDEALDILKKVELDKGMKSKSRIEIWQKIADNLPKDLINYYVRTYLKKRTTWRQFD